MAHWNYLIAIVVVFSLLATWAKWMDYRRKWLLGDRDMAQALAEGWLTKEQLQEQLGLPTTFREELTARWIIKKWMTPYKSLPYGSENTGYELTKRGRRKVERINRRRLRPISQLN